MTAAQPRLAVLTIRPADPAEPPVAALIAYHHATAHAAFPPGFGHAFDASGLSDPAIRLFGAWDGDALAGIGALKRLDDGHAELKSMRTHPDHLRRGVAAAILAHLIAEARACGFQRVSLETGVGPVFEPALALYRRCGFVDAAPFGEYRATDHNQYLSLALSE